jgi:hypothetical protein
MAAPAGDNWAYAYSQQYSGVVPPPGSGSYHYSGGFGTSAGAIDIFQTIDVSAGRTAEVIAAGQGVYDLSAFFSSYLQQNDSSFVRVRFLDAGAMELGTDEVGGDAFVLSLPLSAGSPFGDLQRDWGQDASSGMVPVGTVTVEIQVGSSDADTNHDGYVDLVSFTIIPEPSSFGLLVAGGLALLLVGRHPRDGAP